MDAVITADIVNSTKLSKETFDSLVDDISFIYNDDIIEFYRGDSFQVLTKHADQALLKAVKCRLQAIEYSTDVRTDIRLSISIGNVSSAVTKLGVSMEETFVKSGKLLDQLAFSKKRLHITSGNASIDFTYEIIAEYIDSVMDRVTPKQAKVLHYFFLGKSQLEIARLIKKTTATVNQHIKSSGFNEIESLLQKFETLTNQL